MHNVSDFIRVLIVSSKGFMKSNWQMISKLTFSMLSTVATKGFKIWRPWNKTFSDLRELIFRQTAKLMRISKRAMDCISMVSCLRLIQVGTIILNQLLRTFFLFVVPEKFSYRNPSCNFKSIIHLCIEYYYHIYSSPSVFLFF